MRLIRDEEGRVILVGIENRMLIGRDSSKREVSRAAFRRIESFVRTLPSAVAGKRDTLEK